MVQDDDFFNARLWPIIERSDEDDDRAQPCWHCAYWPEGPLQGRDEPRCRNPLATPRGPRHGCDLHARRTAGTVVVVVGGGAPEAGLVARALDLLHRERHVVMLASGSQSLTDVQAEAWAAERGVACRPYPGHYKVKTGKPTSRSKIEEMLDDVQPDGMVAFPGARHTAAQVVRAKRAGIRVWKPVPWHWRDPRA